MSEDTQIRTNGPHQMTIKLLNHWRHWSPGDCPVREEGEDRDAFYVRAKKAIDARVANDIRRIQEINHPELAIQTP